MSSGIDYGKVILFHLDETDSPKFFSYNPRNKFPVDLSSKLTIDDRKKQFSVMIDSGPNWESGSYNVLLFLKVEKGTSDSRIDDKVRSLNDEFENGTSYNELLITHEPRMVKLGKGKRIRYLPITESDSFQEDAEETLPSTSTPRPSFQSKDASGIPKKARIMSKFISTSNKLDEIEYNLNSSTSPSPSRDEDKVPSPPPKEKRSSIEISDSEEEILSDQSVAKLSERQILIRMYNEIKVINNRVKIIEESLKNSKKSNECDCKNSWENFNVEISSKIPITKFEDFSIFKNSKFCVLLSNYLNNILPKRSEKIRIANLMDEIVEKELQACLIWPSKKANHCKQDHNGNPKKNVPKEFVDFVKTYSLKNNPLKSTIPEIESIIRNCLKLKALFYKKK